MAGVNPPSDIASGGLQRHTEEICHASMTCASQQDCRSSLELFDETNLVITFIHLGVKIKYQLYFVEIENCTYLHVSQIYWLHGKSNIPYMLNAF